jgi:ADP-ribose pyrophosphatase YjhB (NUDIX family)
MPANLKFTVPLALDFEIRASAHKEGRTISDYLLRMVERGMGSSPAIPDDTAVVDKMERGSRGRATAVYLSQPLAGAAQRLAADEQRSQSWIVRSLIRQSLQRRGLLPTPPIAD